MDEIKQNEDIGAKLNELLNNGKEERKQQKELLIKRTKNYESSMPHALGITLERSIDIFFVLEDIVKNIHEGSEVIKHLEESMDLNQREKLLLAFKIGLTVGKFGGLL